MQERTVELERTNQALQREMAERQRLEGDLQRQRQALYQSERLATMGVLLASVAHGLNNPLTVVQLLVDLLTEEATASAQKAQIAELRQATDRCLQIVQNFLALARRSAPQRTKVRLNGIVKEALQLLAHTLEMDHIVVHQQLTEDLPLLDADPVQLHQVVLNLLIDAQQALRDTSAPGQIRLTTAFQATQGRLWLEVADTGPGIPVDFQARIFEPFFTTKPMGIGTGLGLSLCQSIVESHGGSIRVSSQPGQGAAFTVELPVEVVLAPVQNPSTLVNTSPPFTPGSAILVVEDEAAIARGLMLVLRRDGHQVDIAANGRQALRKLQEKDYHLILCDVRMPELDGPGLFRAVAAEQPHLPQRFIFLTGDTLSPEVEIFLKQAGVRHLTKPFTAAQSRAIVREALQGSSS